MSATSTNPSEAHGGPRPAPYLPFVLASLPFAFLAFDRVRANATLTASVGGAALVLLAWAAIMTLRGRAVGRPFRLEVVRPQRSHWVQGLVQSTLYVYWGSYWHDVLPQLPLIGAQLVFLYGVDALLAWSRGRAWRTTLGPLPIILSTNIFIWFRDDWFFLQFAMLVLGACGKEFVRWERGGRRTHIFNPSGFSLSVTSVALIASGLAATLTRVADIADSFSLPPHIYLVIFGLGLVVQQQFSTTLMTLSAALSLVALNLAHHAATGSYWFVFTNLPAPVFLGLHLLVTDPSTSPRTNTGRVIFGTLYGLLAFGLYGVLSNAGETTIYDKLLPIPLLNLSVRWIDRLALSAPFRRIQAFEGRFAPKRLNLAHMAVWATAFGAMIGTGYVEAPHRGQEFAFWQEALDRGVPGAAHGMLEVLRISAVQGDAAAWNEEPACATSRARSCGATQRWRPSTSRVPRAWATSAGRRTWRVSTS
ncbi:MAG: RnfABCDGE type electron transport complex subunit D [Planctomycetota bacterium]